MYKMQELFNFFDHLQLQVPKNQLGKTKHKLAVITSHFLLFLLDKTIHHGKQHKIKLSSMKLYHD